MKSTIKLAWSDGTDREIDADIFGEWAVHQSPRTSHGRGEPKLAWQVTHAPTGLAAICVETVGMTKTEAFRVARRLAKTVKTLPFNADELRVAAQKQHDTGEATGEPFASMGKTIRREICVALGVSPPT